MHQNNDLTPVQLLPAIDAFTQVAIPKVLGVHARWKMTDGSPVITVNGRYTSRAWTDWTLGLFVGQALLLYDLVGDLRLLAIGRDRTLAWMPVHISHTGVHDHGFNIISTYGNLRRLILEGRASEYEADLSACDLALRLSGAVQAMRYQLTYNGKGYIYSFNGPHSLFVDTMRSMRSLVMSHQLGHQLIGEGEQRVNLLHRVLEHAAITAEYCVYYGEGRDRYDVPGRVAQEAIFNTKDGKFRCASTQQGYSPFSTWTRGASWIILGFAELLEYLSNATEEHFEPFGGKLAMLTIFKRVLEVTSDYYVHGYTCADGIPFWDTGAPDLHNLGEYQALASDPYNAHEPVDSSAAAIAAQGLIRYGNFLSEHDEANRGQRYISAGLLVAHTLFTKPYLSVDPGHEGLILHAIYHHPRCWDTIPEGQTVPSGESAMWGDYHALELALLISRMAENKTYTFFSA